MRLITLKGLKFPKLLKRIRLSLVCDANVITLGLHDNAKQPAVNINLHILFKLIIIGEHRNIIAPHATVHRLQVDYVTRSSTIADTAS